MAHPHRKARPAAPKAPKAPPSPYVQVTILFRDRLDKPIEGLDVQIKAGAGAPPAPAWKLGLDEDQAPAGAAQASTPTGAPTPDGASEPTNTPIQNVTNEVQGFTDKDGYATSIQNAARNQPVDVLVKNRHGEYVLKATVVPKKDYSAFRILSSEYHVEATTKLTPKDSLEQDLNIPILKDGEVMTINRLFSEFAPYIGWAQKVTEQGKIKKDFPTKNKETVTDEKTGKQKTKITVEHHYKVVDDGKPRTILLNLLGSRLNYPRTLEISNRKYEEIAKRINCEVAAVRAVAETEASGAPFCENGLPKLRFERHYFFRASLPEAKRADGVWQKQPNPYPKAPDLSAKSYGGYNTNKPKDGAGWSNFDDDVMFQYERMARASKLNLNAAIMACSWGAFQVLAYFYKECGYQSPVELANLMMRGVDEQVDLFFGFVSGVSPRALIALREKNWDSFARYYNGKSCPPSYAIRMRENYEKYK